MRPQARGHATAQQVQRRKETFSAHFSVKPTIPHVTAGGNSGPRTMERQTGRFEKSQCGDWYHSRTMWVCL